MNTVLDGIYDTALVIDPTCISPSAKFSLHGCASYLLFKRDKRKVLKNWIQQIFVNTVYVLFATGVSL